MNRRGIRKCADWAARIAPPVPETHRTAVEFHRKRREKRDFSSELSEIPGIGAKRKMKLLRNFGSIERIAKATIEELKPFVGPKAAAEISTHFENQRKLAPQPTSPEN